MSDPVARAKALLEGVTEGPWEVDNDDPGVWSPECIVIGNYTAADDFNSPMWEDATRADREFIAAARSLVPELVAEVERLRAALADVAIDQYMRENCYTAIKAPGQPPTVADGPWSDPWTEQRADGKADR